MSEQDNDEELRRAAAPASNTDHTLDHFLTKSSNAKEYVKRFKYNNTLSCLIMSSFEIVSLVFVLYFSLCTAFLQLIEPHIMVSSNGIVRIKILAAHTF